MELCDSGRRKISVLTGVRITRVILEKIYELLVRTNEASYYIWLSVKRDSTVHPKFFLLSLY